MPTDPLELSGVEQFAADAARVFGVVTDLDVLARVLPDVESSERPDADTLRCVVRPGFSFLRGKLNVTIARRQVAAAHSESNPLSASFRVESKAIGVQIAVETSLRVEESDDRRSNSGAGSALHWKAHVVERKGLVAAVSASLLRAAAEKVIHQTWGRLRSELSG